MDMKDEASDEDFLDDPIRLIDVEQKRTQTCPATFTSFEKHATLSIDLTDSDVDVVSEEKKQEPSMIMVKSRNIKLLNKCKPLSIKLVDCEKHPWFYKKYVKRLNSESEDYIEISDFEAVDLAMEDNNNKLDVSDKGEKVRNNFEDLSDRSKDEETDIMLPLVSLSKLLLSPNSGKPKIRPVDISSYYSSLGKDAKSNVNVDKSNMKKVERLAITDVCHSQTVQKIDFCQQQIVQEPGISQQKKLEIGESQCKESKISGKTEADKLMKVDLKKNIGLVGLRIKYPVDKTRFNKNFKEEKRVKSKEKKKSKKHKEKKKHYSSVPVILIEGDNTKESLKISLNKEPYVKKKSFKDFTETNDNFEDQKPIIEDFEDQKPIIVSKQSNTVGKEQVALNTLNKVLDSTKILEGEVKELKENRVVTLKPDTVIKHCSQKKIKPVFAGKIKSKFVELFECKPKNKEKNQSNSKKLKDKDAKEEKDRVKKSKEVLNCNNLQLKNVFKNKVNCTNKNYTNNQSLQNQKADTLIFCDNDQKEIFKIKPDAKKSLCIEMPVSNNKDVAFKKNVASSLNFSAQKSVPLKGVSSPYSENDEILKSKPNSETNNNEPKLQLGHVNISKPLPVARHIMPPQIARPCKKNVNKKQNIPKTGEENCSVKKKCDKDKLDPGILDFVKSLGIDIKCSSKKKAARIPTKKSSKSKDVRKTLPDMPSLDKLETVALEKEVKSDVFTHQNKVTKTTVIQQNNVVNLQRVPAKQSLVNSKSETNSLIADPYVINKNNLMRVQPQSGNLETVPLCNMTKNVIDNTTPVNTIESVIKSNPAVSHKNVSNSSVRQNILRSDGAACHQILLKSNGPLSTSGRFVAQIPSSDTNQSASDLVQMPENPNTNQSANNLAHMTVNPNYNMNQAADHLLPNYSKNQFLNNLVQVPANHQSASSAAHNNYTNPKNVNYFQNMPPIDKLALSVNKLDQEIECNFTNKDQILQIQTVVSNRPDSVRARLPEGSRYNPPQFAMRQPAYMERPRMNFGIHYPPNVNCVPINDSCPPRFVDRPNAVPYDSRYYPHQGNIGPHQTYMYQLPPPPPPHYMYRPKSNVNTVPKTHEGSKVIGQNIDGVIRTINLTAPPPKTVETPINSKQEMLQELTKEMQKVHDVPANKIERGGREIPNKLHAGSKRPSADFLVPGPPVKKPNEFVKPKPPPTPAQPNTAVHVQVNNQTTPVVGYSPPILPIPTFQKTYEMLSQAALHCTASLISQGQTAQKMTHLPAVMTEINHDHSKEHTGQKTTENQTTLAPESTLDKNNSDKTGSPIFQNIESGKRRISIDEYKKRVVSSEENDLHKDRVSVKIENSEIKHEPTENVATDCARRQSSDLDLGYDSDSTVKL